MPVAWDGRTQFVTDVHMQKRDCLPSFMASFDWLEPTIIAPTVFMVAAGFSSPEVACIGGLRERVPITKGSTAAVDPLQST